MASVCNYIRSGCARAMTRIVDFTGRCGKIPADFFRAIGIVFLEPHYAAKIGYSCFLNSPKEFTQFSLNPSKLTAEQAEHPPCLLIHGDLHNQAVWLSLAEYAEKHGNQAPLYTVNVCWNRPKKEEFETIDAKIEEIKRQYAEHGKEKIQVNLVGYSRGGFVCFLHAINVRNKSPDQLVEMYLTQGRFDKRPDIGKIIHLGDKSNCLSEYLSNKTKESQYEIIGDLDFLVPDHESALPPSRQFTANATHLELPYTPEVQSKILQWIQD